MRGANFWGVNRRGVAAGPALYAFTTHTFNTGGRVGRYGPSLSALQSAYSSQPWASNGAYFFQGRAQGYQVWQVPKTGIYEIEIAGARGQNSTSNFGFGLGAIIRARVQLNVTDRLEMVVGQVPGNSGSVNPNNSYAGSGGGSFIAYYNTNTPVLVAGGGAGLYGSWTSVQTIHNGQTRRQPRYSGYSYAPANDGTEPAIGYGGPGYHGGGGGGFFGPGTAYPGRAISDSTMTTDTSGQQYTTGAGFVGTASGVLDPLPGTWYAIGGNATALTSEGGFGGGGGGHSGNNTSGGGGGYSGGVGGNTSLGGSYLSGTGGGSFIINSATSVATSDGQYDGLSTFNGSSITNIGSFNGGSGYITITFIS